jgi:hypothetical protein
LTSQPLADGFLRFRRVQGLASQDVELLFPDLGGAGDHGFEVVVAGPAKWKKPK